MNLVEWAIAMHGMYESSLEALINVPPSETAFSNWRIYLGESERHGTIGERIGNLSKSETALSQVGVA